MSNPYRRTALHSALVAGIATLVCNAHAAPTAAELGARVVEFQNTVDEATTDFQRYIVFLGEQRAAAERSEIEAVLDPVSRLASVPLEPVRRLATGGWLVQARTPVSRSQAQAVMRELALDPAVAHAQPDYVYQIASNDPNEISQWHLTAVTDPGYDCMPAATCRQAGANVEAAWSYSTGSGIVLAVLDTGYTAHPDLAPNLATPNYTTGKVGYDFVSNSPVTYDQNDPAIGDPLGRDSNSHDPGDYVGSIHSSWHGTHVMGLAAAVYNNGLYGAGVAPNAKILPIRVLGAGGGSDADISDAIIWAAGGQVAGVPYNSTPARVINMSLGAAHACTSTSNVQLAINNARANGTVIVVAAGNSAINVSGFSPAGCSGVIAVAATGYTGAIAALNGGTFYSNYGAGVALAAPGGGYIRQVEVGWTNVPIYSDLNTGLTTPGAASFAGDEGTSMAAPLVSGLAADVTALKPWLTVDQVKTYITGHTHPFGTGGIPAAAQAMGTGLMDAAATLVAVSSAVAPAAATFTATPNPVVIPAGATTGPYTIAWNVPGYTTVDSYASINGGPVQFTGIVQSSGSVPEVATYGQTITWYLYPHGHTPTSALVKSVVVSNHH